MSKQYIKAHEGLTQKEFDESMRKAQNEPDGYLAPEDAMTEDMVDHLDDIDTQFDINYDDREGPML